MAAPGILMQLLRCGAALYNLSCDVQLFFARQQRHPRHFFQVQPHGIITADRWSG